MNIRVKVYSDLEVVRDHLRGWRSCTDPESSQWPGHKEAMKMQGWCPCCAETERLPEIRDGNILALYIYDDILLRVDCGGTTYLLDYPKIRKLCP